MFGTFGYHLPRIASLLARHGADIDFHRAGSGMTPLRYAAQRGNLIMVKTLTGMGANLTIEGPLGIQAIHAAVQFGHSEVVRFFLDEAGLDSQVEASHFDERALKRDNSCNLLHFAAMGDGGVGMIDLLAGRGLDPLSTSANSKSPLYYAISNQNLALVQHLHSKGANIVPALLDTAETESLGDLLAGEGNSIDLDSQGPDGRTAASIYAEEGRVTALKSLISAGASATFVDGSGRSPLLWAAFLGNISAVKYFALKRAIVSFDDMAVALEHHISSPAASQIFVHDLILAFAQPFDEEIALKLLELGIERGWEHVVAAALRAPSPLSPFH
ncbi:ankyrin repeat-containing domain protein [Podospora didyma]|uniref:protein S-acyltransferase n=1 Tax=Podospora didyma TaxID=330526 RepID=A0AAE0N4G5_9PEZI|nr:ankyrin repeat-containing domain protein [Podospora didyma]